MFLSTHYRYIIYLKQRKKIPTTKTRYSYRFSFVKKTWSFFLYFMRSLFISGFLKKNAYIISPLNIYMTFFFIMPKFFFKKYSLNFFNVFELSQSEFFFFLFSDLKYYSKLSDSLYRMNKEYVAKAEADYKKVIELKDDYIDAYFNMGALTNNKTTEIVEKMNAISAPSQAEYDKKWALMKKDQDAILTVALGYFTKALEYAEALPTTTEADKTYKNGTMVSILISMQQVYANLGDEKKTMETKRRRMEIE